MVGRRNDRQYIAKRDALRRQAKRNNTPCALCGKPIDFDLEWRHPMSFTANHITAIANGGSMTGPLEPMHRSCNARLGARDKAQVKQVIKPRTSRQW